MRRCKSACLHRQLVEDYRAAREREEAVRDEETIGHATENANYAREHGIVTFKRWLIDTAGTYSPAEPSDEEQEPWDYREEDWS